MFRMKLIFLMAVALLATVVAQEVQLDADSFKDKNDTKTGTKTGTKTKPPTVVKRPPVKRTSPPSKQKAPKNPVEKVRTPKDKPGKKCTKWFCNSSLKNIMDEIGHSFKLCSDSSCSRLRIFKNVMFEVNPKYTLSGKDQRNFERATTPKTNCTANLAPICTRMQKRIRKAFTKGFDSQCTSATCPDLFEAQRLLRGQNITVASIASVGYPQALYMGCAGSYSMSPDVPTFAPTDSEGKDNLTFESCLDYCAGNNMPYMVIADQTECNCYLNEQEISSGDHEPDGGFGGPYECNAPCFGDGDTMYGAGCGKFFEGNAAFYRLEYEFSS